MDAVGNSARLERAHLFTTGFKSSNSYSKCQTGTSKMKMEDESSKYQVITVFTKKNVTFKVREENKMADAVSERRRVKRI